MWKKIALAGAVGAAVIGAATVSLASSPANGGSSSTAAGVPAAMNAPLGANGEQAAGRPGKRWKDHLNKRLDAGLKNALHGEFVTKDDSGKFVTHELYRGDVTAVSATSISVHAADGASMTYTVNADSKVFIRGDGKPHQGAISDVKVGDQVVVTGIGSPHPTAKFIVDGVPK